jgi:hypothetical protein
VGKELFRRETSSRRRAGEEVKEIVKRRSEIFQRSNKISDDFLGKWISFQFAFSTACRELAVYLSLHYVSCRLLPTCCCLYSFFEYM